jgi:hypothetical protein
MDCDDRSCLCTNHRHHIRSQSQWRSVCRNPHNIKLCMSRPHPHSLAHFPVVVLRHDHSCWRLRLTGRGRCGQLIRNRDSTSPPSTHRHGYPSPPSPRITIATGTTSQRLKNTRWYGQQ